MIDTVKLNLYDVKFKDSSFVTIIREFMNDTETKRDLFINQDGEIISGSKGYLNNEFFNLSIKPQTQLFNDYTRHLQTYKKQIDYIPKKNSDDVLEFEHIRKGKFLELNIKDQTNCNFILQTSLSKLYALKTESEDKNLNYLNEKQVKQSFNFLNKKLSEFGMLVDLDSAKLIRYDTFINLPIKYSFQTYSSFLKSFRLSRKKLLDFNQDTLSWINQQNEICIYDKQKELIQHEMFTDKKIMRIENRFLRKKKVFKILGSNKVQELLNKEIHIEQMKEVYKNLFTEKNEFFINDTFQNLLESGLSLNKIKEKIFFTYLINNNKKEYLIDAAESILPKRSFYRFRRNLEDTEKNKIKETKTDLIKEIKIKYENELEYLERNK